MQPTFVRYIQRRFSAPGLISAVVCLLFLTGGFTSSSLCAQAASETQLITKNRTNEDIEFGVWGSPGPKPAPTLFILASTIDETLGDAYFRQCGNELSKKGYLLVSIDLPCHGKQHRSGEPKGLAGWSVRCKAGNNFVDETNKRLTNVLDFLIQSGHTDASQVCICGTSRGGYLALHFAAHEPRIKAVAAFAPVTDLTALREFKGIENNSLVQSLSIIHQADEMAGRPVWIVIGDQDERVGTQHAIDLARAITKSSITRKRESLVDLHVLAEPRGHTTPPGSPQLAADWLHRQIQPE